MEKQNYKKVTCEVIGFESTRVVWPFRKDDATEGPIDRLLPITGSDNVQLVLRLPTGEHIAATITQEAMDLYQAAFGYVNGMTPPEPTRGYQLNFASTAARMESLVDGAKVDVDAPIVDVDLDESGAEDA